MVRTFALLAVLLPALGGCLDMKCEDRILAAKPDLEGSLVAYQFVRNCGATTSYSIHVAIGTAGETPGEAEMVFVADSDHGAAELDGDAPWLEMHWTAPHKLSVAYAEKARVFRQIREAQGARIAYRATHRLTVEEFYRPIPPPIAVPTPPAPVPLPKLVILSNPPIP